MTHFVLSIGSDEEAGWLHNLEKSVLQAEATRESVRCLVDACSAANETVKMSVCQSVRPSVRPSILVYSYCGVHEV